MVDSRWVEYPDLRRDVLDASAFGTPLVFAPPGSPEVAFQIVETQVFGPEDRWYLVGSSRAEVIASGPLGRTFSGWVQGGVGIASFYVGDYGVYGTVELPSAVGHFRPDGPDGGFGGFALWVASPEGQIVATLEGEPHPEAVSETTQLIFDAEKGFIDQRPDWYDWVASAFSYSDGFWADVGIDASTHGIYGWSTTNLADSTICGDGYDVVEDYSDFLRDNGATVAGVDAYQLVTRLNLDGSCHGSANFERLGGYRAASVIEGLDVGWDAYDPGNQKHRGHLSIHEFAHNHGSGHYGNCQSWFYNCNIMKSPIDLYDWYGGWWTQGSKDQIANFAWPRL